MTACTSVDTGSPARIAPAQLGNAIRFYRASFKNAWSCDRTTRFASREVYAAKSIALKEGENFFSLFMIPDQNRLASVFGTNRLPAGATIAESTRIEWYATTAESEAVNVVWLSNAGIWLHEAGGSADDMPIPLNEGFNMIIPPGSGNLNLVLAGRVPTSVSESGGHVIPITANQSYNIASYNLPYRVKLKSCELKESGFTGVAPGASFNPNNSDEIRVLRKGGGSMQTPLYRILLNANGQFQFWSGGSGLADDFMLDPDFALVIYTRKSTTNFTWNVCLPYPEPTVNVSP